MSRPVEYRWDDLVPPPDTKCRVHRVGGKVSTIETPDKVIKDARGFGRVGRAEKCLSVYREQGWSGAPASPSSCFSKILEEAIGDGSVPRPRQALPERLRVDTSGVCYLWIEQTVPRGPICSKVFHYDINEAFWSATSKGLPVRFYPYRSGDDRWVGRVEIKGAAQDLPWWWEKRDTAIITGTDVRYYGLDVDVLDAVTYEDLSVDLTPLMKRAHDLFGSWVAKRIRQQSWGLFAMREGAVQSEIIDEDGETQTEWESSNRWRCHPWAIIITRRVMRSVHRAISEGEGVSCFVDSVLARNPLPTGSAPGTWRHEGTYDRGVYLFTPGVWDTRPRSTKRPSHRWKRHAGIEDSTSEWRPDVMTGDISGEATELSRPPGRDVEGASIDDVDPHDRKDLAELQLDENLPF
jgi:hypothetical protein